MTYVAKPQDGIAWVSSASTGLGRAVAMALAEDGWTVAVSGRSPVDLDTLVAACAECPGKIVPYPGDLTKGGIVAQIVKRIESKQGPIVLAVLPPSEDEAIATGALSREMLDEAYAASFVSVTNALLPLLPSMRQRRLGQIALVSSIIGYGGLPDMRATGAAKAALINLAESLHSDLATDGVRLQVITPGPLGRPPENAGAFARRAYLPFDQAASRVVAGLRSPVQFEIAFPRRVIWPMKAVKLLPYPLYFALTKFVRRMEPQARPRRTPRTSTPRAAGPSDPD
jgi:NAD(P)-dependent dehydrogenase (short-subunit alcohol dehydrogenase family)